jgi:carbamoyl-phosphate synthase large subunit
MWSYGFCSAPDRSPKQLLVSGIFDEIAFVEPAGDKANHIREKDAILVDDSFSERKAVSEKLGVLTFDCSMIEMFIDERL